MKVTFIVVPPGGGEADYSFDVQMPDAPRVGEYVSLFVEGDGYGVFRALYVIHELKARPTNGGGHTEPTHDGALVHIEPVKHPLNLQGGMKRLFDFYNNNPRWAGKVQEFPDSGY